MLVITGGSGFIGQALLMSLPKGTRVRLLLRRAIVPPHQLDWEIRLGSLTDLAFLKAALQGARQVVHLAGVLPRFHLTNAEAHESHVETTQALLEAAHKNLRHFLLVSSAYVHEPHHPGEALSEQSPLNGRTTYARAKIKAENIARTIARRRRIPLTILRPAMVYGPGNRTGFMTNLIHESRRRYLPWPGTGDIRLSFIYISDLVAALHRAIARPRPGIYLLSGPPIRVSKLAELLNASLLPLPASLLKPLARLDEVVSRSMLRFGIEREPLISFERLHHLTADRAYQATHFEKTFDWQAKTSLEQGLRATKVWLGEHI